MQRITGILAAATLATAVTVMPAVAQEIEPPRGPSGADGTFNCADFDTQPQAQGFFEAEGGPEEDPNDLDRDNDGVACEGLPGGAGETITSTGVDPGTEAAEDTETADDADVEVEIEVEEATDDDADVELPVEETVAPTEVQAGSGGLTPGGMPAGVLLLMALGVGLLGNGLVRARRR